MEEEDKIFAQQSGRMAQELGFPNRQKYNLVPVVYR